MAAADGGTEGCGAAVTREEKGRGPRHGRQGMGEVASHMGVFAGVDDLALPVHDPVDGDP